MKRYFIFGEFNTWADWRCTLTAKNIPDAEPKYNYIELPGAHGTIDVTEALTGEVAYNDRTLTASFMCSEGTYLDREMLLRNIMAALHGKKMQIIEPDDPEHYFMGRVRVRDVQKFQTYATFTLEAQCDPWRYAVEETHRLVEVAEAAAPVMMRTTRAAATVVNYGNCGAEGDNLTWTLYSDGTLVISGTGAMANYGTSTNNKAPWIDYYPVDPICNSLIIEPGVTSIGTWAFNNCSWLTGTLSIPSTVTSIGTGAFSGCTGLTGLTMSEGLETLKDFAFDGCVNIEGTIEIPSSVTSIGQAAFKAPGPYSFAGNAPTVIPTKGDSMNRQPSVPATSPLYYTVGATGWTDSSYYNAEAGTWNGYTLRVGVCEHSRKLITRTSNGDYTHTVTTTCSDCGEVVSTIIEVCADADGDGKCDDCGGDVCDHVTTTNYKDNRNLTHTKTIVCVKCGAELSREVEPCNDGDGDEICDLCGSDFATIPPSEVDAVLYNNGVKTLCPELHVEGQVVVAFDSLSAELSTGEYKVAEFKLRQGANLVHVEGNGSVEFIYREATL